MSTLKVDAIRHNSATSDAITTAADGTCTAKITSVGGAPLSNRNKIINGANQISQRATSVSSITTSAYRICDRWKPIFSGTGTWTLSQSTTSPDGFSKSFKFDCTTANASLSAGNFMMLQQRIEGFNVQDFAKGTSSAKQFSLSFYVKTNKTGTYIVELYDSANSRTCSASYTVSDSNWNRYTLTFPADTTGTIDDDNTEGLRLDFWLASGTTFSSGTLVTAWASQTNANRAVGQVNLADNTSNEWYITGVQLEVGDTATSFEHRNIGDELSLCERYFEILKITRYSFVGSNHSTGSPYVKIYWNTKKRAAPTITLPTIGQGTNQLQFIGGNGSYQTGSSSASLVHIDELSSGLQGSGYTGNSTNAEPAMLYGSGTALVQVSAEL